MQQYQRRVHGEFQLNMKSVTMVSIVFTLSFCLNLVAGKNLPYKGSPPAEAYEMQGYSGIISMNNAAYDRTVGYGDVNGPNIYVPPGGHKVIPGDVNGGLITVDDGGTFHVKGDMNGVVIDNPGK